MEKKEHIAYWKNGAAEDLETALYNISGKRHVPALFFFHLTIEKLLKGIWVKDNFSNTPPFTHDLLKLSSETTLELSGEDYDFLGTINSWNIEARYPDFKKTLHRIATDAYMKVHVDRIKKLYECLRLKL